MAKVKPPSRTRIGIETGIALFAGILGVVTIFWHDWIEALAGWDPDHHNGRAEWLIVAALLVISVVLGTLARRDWRVRAAASRTPATRVI
jgi:undecaprenyl pyrophosphate phosphatase UppP